MKRVHVMMHRYEEGRDRDVNIARLGTLCALASIKCGYISCPQVLLSDTAILLVLTLQSHERPNSPHVIAIDSGTASLDAFAKAQTGGL